MASVVRRRRKDGSSSWYARYRDGAGKDRVGEVHVRQGGEGSAAEAAVGSPARVALDAAGPGDGGASTRSAGWPSGARR